MIGSLLIFWAAGQSDVEHAPARNRLRKLNAEGPASNTSERRLSWVDDALITLLLGSSSVIVGEHPITMFDTTFTNDNYQREQLEFLRAGMRADDGVAFQEWYLEGTGQSQIVPGVVRQGPGPNTTTHLGYDDVKLLLENFGDKIEQGKLQRGNELGMQILGDGAWPEAPGGRRSIFLGQSNENHAFLRPYFANALDKDATWSDQWLKDEATSFLKDRNQIDSSDLKWWVAQLLHKIHLNMHLTEDEAKEFADYMSKIITLIPFPAEVLQNWAVEGALDAQNTLRRKEAYLEQFKAAVASKYAGEDFVVNGDNEKIELLASAFLDSVQFAGGVSVPTVIQYVLALTHMADASRPSDLQGLTLSSENYLWILMETLRKFAPVAGVPFWEMQDDGSFKHVVPNVAQALMDSSVFENPLTFKNRGMEKYQSTIIEAGMPWAGPAIHSLANGSFDTAAPHSHNCPGQQLSLKIMKAVIEAFIERGAVQLGGSSGWSAVDSSAISVTGYSASAFTLLKRGHSHTTGCAIFPSCNAGYAWVSTQYCSWGRRDWTCKVQ